MTGAVDYLGILGILAPLILALFAVAYRMGTLSENVRNMREDLRTVQTDVKGIQKDIAGLSKRKADVRENSD